MIFFILTVHALHKASVDTALAAGKVKAWRKYGTTSAADLIVVF